MSFPLTATVVDALDGSGTWPTGFGIPNLGDTGTLQISGGSLVQLAAGNGFATTNYSLPLPNAPSPAAPFEMFIQLQVRNNKIFRIGFLADPTDVNSDGVLIRYDTSTNVNNLIVEQYPAGTTLTGPVGQAIVSGNAVGVQYDGTTFRVWQGSDYHTSWNEIAALAASGITGPPAAGWVTFLEVNQDASQAYNFYGAGPFAPPAQFAPHRMPLGV